MVSLTLEFSQTFLMIQPTFVPNKDTVVWLRVTKGQISPTLARGLMKGKTQTRRISTSVSSRTPFASGTSASLLSTFLQRLNWTNVSLSGPVAKVPRPRVQRSWLAVRAHQSKCTTAALCNTSPRHATRRHFQKPHTGKPQPSHWS